MPGVRTTTEYQQLKRKQAQLKQIRKDKAQAKAKKAVAAEAPPDNLYSFITYATPAYHPPHHLGPLVDKLHQVESNQSGTLRFCFSVPPRHFKSYTLLYFVAWYLYRNPDRQVVYASHTMGFAKAQSKLVRRLCRQLGLEFTEDSNQQDEWQLLQGGGLLARGVGGEVMGRGADLIIVDDPIKSRKEAESALERDKVYDWLLNDIYTRLTPNGSLFVIHTRWHPDDLIGRLSNDGWDYTNIPAIDDDGNPLLPNVWSLESLVEKRFALGEYSFSALYQGRPRPRGGNVFGAEPRFYTELPKDGFRRVYGLDLAYSANTSSDYSTCIELIEHDGMYYVVDVLRVQVAAPQFAMQVRHRTAVKPGNCYWYAANNELGAADFFTDAGVSLTTFRAATDKFIRSQPVASAWNAGRVLLPHDPDKHPWLTIFLDELQNFTGISDPHDDQVDALAAAYDSLSVPQANYSKLAERFKHLLPRRRY